MDVAYSWVLVETSVGPFGAHTTQVRGVFDTKEEAHRIQRLTHALEPLGLRQERNLLVQGVPTGVANVRG